jgi:hypothetical protein
MSHDDTDHNPETCESHIQPIIVGRRFARDLQTSYLEVSPNGSVRYEGITFSLNYSKQLEVQRNTPQVRRFHCDWWNISSEKSQIGILFIGNLDFPEVQVIEPFVDYIVERSGRPLNAILLPSYGGVSAGLHQIPQGASPLALQQSIEKVVDSIIKSKHSHLKFGALPHPIDASWSEFQFLRLRD